MSQTNYFISGTSVSLQRADELIIANELPAAVYYVRVNPMTKEMYLSRTDEFHPPEKLYGDTVRNADRIINTFSHRPKSTGVLLEGVKGSGKTLLTKVVSSRLIEIRIPTIIIDQRFSGPAFNEFMGKIGTALVLFDEFEKTFRSDNSEDSNDESAQEELLTLFDGTVESKKLFMLSVNNSWQISDFFINRPGRIFYSFNFRGLTESSIREYCLENLKDREQIESIVRISQTFKDFTFDALSSLVEEMNRYDESAADAIRFMNITPSRAEVEFDVEVVCEEHPEMKFRPSSTSQEPTIKKQNLYIHDSKHDFGCYVTKEHLVDMGRDGSFTYKIVEDGKTIHVKLTRSKEEQEFNFDAY